MFGRIDAGPLDAQKLGVEMITIEGIRAGRSPTAPACREVTLLGAATARAYVGGLSGCIVLDMHRRSRLTPSLIMHEIGHALGFWHTRNVADVMYGQALQPRTRGEVLTPSSTPDASPTRNRAAPRIPRSPSARSACDCCGAYRHRSTTAE